MMFVVMYQPKLKQTSLDDFFVHQTIPCTHHISSLSNTLQYRQTTLNPPLTPLTDKKTSLADSNLIKKYVLTDSPENLSKRDIINQIRDEGWEIRASHLMTNHKTAGENAFDIVLTSYLKSSTKNSKHHVKHSK